MQDYTVYMHKAPNNKVYIGVTKLTLQQRWGKDGSGYHTQTLFWRAIQKYGWNNFTHIIIATGLEKNEAFDLEVKLIAEYKSNDSKYGYNQSIGGEKGPNGCHHKLSLETRKKMSDSRLGTNHPMYSKHHTEESKNKIRNSMIGNKNALGAVRSDEFKQKVSKSQTGRVVSQETREKLRQRALEQWKRQKGET